MDVPAGDVSSDSSDVELVERREDNPTVLVPPPANQQHVSHDERLFMQPAVFDAWLRLQRSNRSTSSFQLPMSDPTNPSWLKTDSFFRPPCVGLIPAVVTPQDTSAAPLDSGLISKMASNRLRYTTGAH